MDDPDNDTLLNVGQAAAYLDKSRQWVFKLAVKGRLGKKIAGHWVFRQQELEDYKNKPKAKGGRPPKQRSM